MHSKTFEQEPELTSGFDSTAFSRNALSSWQNLAAIIDHTLLKPGATRDEVIAICREAAEYRFACAMVNPVWVSLARSVLGGNRHSCRRCGGLSLRSFTLGYEAG